MSIYDINGNAISLGSSQFFDVAAYGATGDGLTDDASAIQSALDACNTSGGGVVYFPYGTYLLSTYLFFYSNQILWFEHGATLLQGGSINALLMTYCGSSVTEYNGTHDVLIYGATFDGGDYTTNNTLLGTVHAKNITIKNCTFKNGHGTWHNVELNSTYNGKVINCDFEASRRTSTNACMIQIDAINNTSTWPWTDNIGSVDSTVSKYIEICGNVFHDSSYSPAVGNHSTAVDDFIRIHDNVFDALTGARGSICFQSVTNVDVYDNTFNGCTTGLASGGSTYNVYDNRFVDVTTTSSSSASNIHDNMVNGTFTE